MFGIIDAEDFENIIISCVNVFGSIVQDTD